MSNTFHDFEARSALAWSICNKLLKLWKSKLNRNMKIRVFRVTLGSVLLSFCIQICTSDKTFHYKDLFLTVRFTQYKGYRVRSTFSADFLFSLLPLFSSAYLAFHLIMSIFSTYQCMKCKSLSSWSNQSFKTEMRRSAYTDAKNIQNRNTVYIVLLCTCET